jgi:transcriptional regulator with XRE-family HTH domain
LESIVTEGEARASDESVPATVRLAREIRRRRKAVNMSQPELANQIGYTRQYVSLAERPGKNLPSQELVRALDGALGATGSLLKIRDEAKAEQQGRRRAFSAGSAQAAHPAPSLITSARDDAVRAVVPRLRRILGAHDLPDDGPVRPLDMLDRAVSNLVEQRLQARYAQIAEGLPELLAEILRAAHTCGDGQRRQIALVDTGVPSC